MSNPSPVDLSCGQGFAQGFPRGCFRHLRAAARVFWHEPTADSPGGEGFWVASRCDNSDRVFRHPALFSSEEGSGRPDAGTQFVDDKYAGQMMIVSDNPKHARLRALVTSGFTPATLVRLAEDGAASPPKNRASGSISPAMPLEAQAVSTFSTFST
jgi:cytochrome P450